MVIDSSLFIEHIRAKDKQSTTLYKLSDEPKLFITSVSVYELYMGAKTKEKQRDLQLLIGHLPVLPFTEDAAIKAAEIHHKLRQSNQLIEFRDIFIAAICLAHGMPIATLNKKHFKRVEGLKILR